jgi:hypothetical protein
LSNHIDDRCCEGSDEGLYDEESFEGPWAEEDENGFGWKLDAEEQRELWHESEAGI